MPRERTAGAVPDKVERWVSTPVAPGRRERNGRIERQQIELMGNGRAFCVACCAGFAPLAGVEFDDQECPEGHGAWYVDGLAPPAWTPTWNTNETAKATGDGEAVVRAPKAAVVLGETRCSCGRPSDVEGKKTCRRCLDASLARKARARAAR